jgi:CTP synthase (UTP-ammonia lyase)
MAKRHELEHRRVKGDLGGTMRLGPYRADLNHGSRVAEIYGGAQISVARSRSTAMPAVAILSVH